MRKIVNTDTVVEWVQSWLTKDKYYHPYSKQANIPISELYDILEQMPSAETHENRTETHACDCISRQAAIDALDAVFPVDPMKSEYAQGIACGAALAKTYVEQLPSAEPEQKWIPCSERLPEVHESGNSVSGIYMQSNPVLVYGTCEYEDNAQFHVVTYCDDLDGNTYWSTELDAITVSGVIAWMPLPEPWKGEKDG